MLIEDADDWSLLIKLHALAEAAATHAVTKAVGREELNEPISKLNARSKWKFIAALGLITAEEFKFLGFLSDLRNTVTHNLASVHFTFAAHVASLPPNDRKQFFAKLTLPLPAIGFDDAQLHRLFDVHLEYAIWLSTIVVIASMFGRKRTEEARRQLLERDASAHRVRKGNPDASAGAPVRGDFAG